MNNLLKVKNDLILHIYFRLNIIDTITTFFLVFLSLILHFLFILLT